MPCIRIPNGIVTVGGPTLRMVVNGKSILFEDSERFGPTPVTGRDKERRLGPRHPFWAAYSRWCAAGKPIGDEVMMASNEPHPANCRCAKCSYERKTP